MIGAQVFYAIPMPNGWRILRGVIIRANATALVVADSRYGVRRVINRGWLMGYIWERKAA